MMRFGIPKYRLPRDVLEAEIRRILDLGVELELDCKVSDVREAKRAGNFDAVFLAVGAHLGKRTYVPAGSASHILDAVSMLRSMEGADRPLLGRHVVVYGGGNTAIDAARTAKRLGAEEAIIVYRRTRNRMPAHDLEVEEALEEGVLMKWLSTIKRAGPGKLVVERMELDETGFPQPTGEFEELAADSLVLALGQETDLSLLDGVPGIEVDGGVVKVGADMMTGHPGIFAGGDMVPAERTVTVAIGHGKRAAREIDAWLRGRPYDVPAEAPPADYDELNTWYYADAPQNHPSSAGGHSPAIDVRRGRARPRRVHRPVRGAALHVVRKLLRLRQLLRGLSRQRGDKARPHRFLRLRHRLRLLQGLRDLRPGVPMWRDRDGA
jgi:thioredoxin reductase